MQYICFSPSYMIFTCVVIIDYKSEDDVNKGVYDHWLSVFNFDDLIQKVTLGR